MTKCLDMGRAAPYMRHLLICRDCTPDLGRLRMRPFLPCRRSRKHLRMCLRIRRVILARQSGSGNGPRIAVICGGWIFRKGGQVLIRRLGLKPAYRWRKVRRRRVTLYCFPVSPFILRYREIALARPRQ